VAVSLFTLTLGSTTVGIASHLRWAGAAGSETDTNFKKYAGSASLQDEYFSSRLGATFNTSSMNRVYNAAVSVITRQSEA
jgi:hypothetical protein